MKRPRPASARTETRCQLILSLQPTTPSSSSPHDIISFSVSSLLSTTTPPAQHRPWEPDPKERSSQDSERAKRWTPKSAARWDPQQSLWLTSRRTRQSVQCRRMRLPDNRLSSLRSNLNLDTLGKLAEHLFERRLLDVQRPDTVLIDTLRRNLC